MRIGGGGTLDTEGGRGEGFWRRFPANYWLVVLFEFFERGAYYGMMSILSVYFTEELLFSKESVGIIKSTIQPLLYFLPIISGAIADRFGYRKTLMIAFSLLGTGYFLTSQVTGYTLVFISLVVMGIGAGAFKPVISGSIARLTDPSTSTLGFGIYYWSINLGAFLFPLFLVPYLKNNIGWNWVILASAICTGLMIIPTILFFREPPISKEEREKIVRMDIVATIARAFEIIYSPVVLIFSAMRRRGALIPISTLISITTLLSLYLYLEKGFFVLFFVSLIVDSGLLIMFLQPFYRRAGKGGHARFLLTTAASIFSILWLIPQVSIFGRVVSTVIYLTVLSIYLFDLDEVSEFRENSKFLLMLLIYSGFWILYFQMFDSVLWYVRDYVDASPLDRFINSLFLLAGVDLDWRFDIEHVTVINAGTIILLQIMVSNIVKRFKALPTMVFGIFLGTAGMAILAISANIWVFLSGIVVFSIGEMTTHPRFIAYVGETAPRTRVALYMGYIFLYGVIGSSIGGVLGANLYVHFVDHLKSPRTLWLIFSAIGVLTIIALLLYNRLFSFRERRG